MRAGAAAAPQAGLDTQRLEVDMRVDSTAFKRDILKTVIDVEKEIIRGGNLRVHGGDVIMDAQLYEGPGGRRDMGAYKKLYGFRPLWVLTISEFFAVHQS